MHDQAEAPGAVVRGEFYTDGSTYVFKLAGLPLSGVGESPDTAFEDLMKAQGAAGPLVERLRELSIDQRSEAVRATVIRWLIIALVAFCVVGGALVGAAALAPAVSQSISEARPGVVDQTRPDAPDPGT